MSKRICSIGGCDKSVHARDWCQMHYVRWKMHGDPTFRMVLRGATAEERFWTHVDKNGPLPGGDTLAAGKGPCWLWTASILNGYGRFNEATRPIRAHRFSYLTFVGPIPKDHQVDHLCRVRNCVNPDHLEPVTPRENVIRGQTYLRLRRENAA